MDSLRKPYSFSGNKVLLDYSSIYCDSTAALLKSDLFREILRRYLIQLEKRGSHIHEYLKNSFSGIGNEEILNSLVSLFRLLATHSVDEIGKLSDEHRMALARPDILFELKDQIYNFWVRMERVTYMNVPKRQTDIENDLHYAQFVTTNEELKNLILLTYRRIGENLIVQNPRVLRQLPAWANMAMLVRKIEWDCPEQFGQINEIPFVRVCLIFPPLILYPKANTRKGSFEETKKLPDGLFDIKQDEWFCFPAKVGDLLAFIYFHRDFCTLALSMSNLFELASKAELKGGKPDLMIFFGIAPEKFPMKTGYHYHEETSTLIGMVSNINEVDYFGYFKKMTLTLHNLRMIKKKNLPIHGAMVAVELKDGSTANVVIIGDSGAGKSETLEALRLLAEDNIKEMKIIFDDMGSLRLDDKGDVIGYGTETGAFVRIDDLSPAYAYEQVGRSIFMNPHLKNARIVIPVTSYETIMRGHKVDIFLYANNYDLVPEGVSAIEFFKEKSEAIEVFRYGARMAKGTTDEKGLVHTYFANPFGAPQEREAHEKIAETFFKAMFAKGVKVGQIRTRLGLDGYEQKGPEMASKDLFEVIKGLKK
ncbi:MAG: phosphoenolpyruvate carboxykinase [Nitrospinota bacterium]|nr:phosphoenolpyruvate carboxykinase [Nitrospinota bacterium]